MTISACEVLEGLYRCNLREEDCPFFRFRNENDTHSVHPGALFAGEKGILP